MDKKNFYSITPNNKNIIRNNISYAAIGDGYAAGYNSKLGFIANGMLNNEKELSGLSYPSFFASLLLKNKSFKLNSFKNFAMPLTTIQFWNSLILNNKPELLKQQNILDFVQAGDWNVLNPFRNYFSDQFKNWNVKKDDFKIVHETIKSANLLTLSIGFTDFLLNMPITKILAFTKSSNKNVEYIKEIEDFFSKTNQKIKQDLDLFLKNLKSITNANIVFVSYIDPFFYFNNLLDELFTLKEKVYNPIKNAFLEFEQIQKEICAKYSINFVNCYDKTFWKNNIEYLAENIFSLHPTEVGYKKIAYDLYTKLFIDKDQIIYDINSETIIRNYICDKEYWINDINSRQKIFDLKIKTLDLFKEVYGNNLNYNILINDELILKYKDILYPFLRMTPYFNAYIRYYNNDILDFVAKGLEKKFEDSLAKYDSIKELLKYLGDAKYSKELFLTLTKDNKFEKFLFVVQKKIYKDHNTFKKITLVALKKVIKEVLVDNQKLSYDIIKQLFNSKIIENNKEQILKLSETFLKDFMQTDILDQIINFKLNKQYENIRKYLSNLSTFIELAKFLVESIANHSLLYSPLDTFDEFSKHWIINNKYNILYLLNKTFFEISSDEKIKGTVEFIRECIYDFVPHQIIKGNDERALTLAIEDILVTLKSNPKNLNNIFLNILNKLKSFSVFDYVTKKRKQKPIFNVRSLITTNNLLFLTFKLAKNFIKIKNIIRKNKI